MDPVNASVASFDFRTHEFTFNSDVSGVYVDPDDIYNRLLYAIQTHDYNASLVFYPQTILARVTKAELINSFCLVSTYTTETTKDNNRNTNIRLTAEAINGTTVLPGAIFSFNDTTGERTPEKGYKPAGAIARGESIEEVGGGVCQTSSTLFNAVARANL